MTAPKGAQTQRPAQGSPLTRVIVVAGFLIGALIGTWLPSVAATHWGGYHSGEILRSGTAKVIDCRRSLLLTMSCQAEVEWNDGETSRVRAQFTYDASGATVAVDEHERKVYLWSRETSDPVTLEQGFPAGRGVGLATVVIHVGMVIGALVGGLGVGLLIGRRQRPADSSTPQS